jgi:hypothetical protein
MTRDSFGALSFLFCSTLALGACAGAIGPGETAGTRPPGQSGGTLTGGVGGNSVVPPVQPPTPPALGNNCGPTPAVYPAPLARLTARQYSNTLRDLLPGLTVERPQWPAENLVDGFDNNAQAQTPSFELIDALHATAQRVSALAAEQQATFAACTMGTASVEEDCGRKLIVTFGRRAFRRPLTVTELDRYGQFFNSTRARRGYKIAVALTTQALLEAPQVVYRLEIGEPVAGSSTLNRLTHHEMASRLSYFLTETMPDPELMAAADGQRLGTTAEIEAQARRLLAKPAAREMTAHLHDGWLKLDQITDLDKSTQLFPGYSEKTTTALRESARMFVDHVFWDTPGSKLSTLLTEPKAFVDSVLAPIYEVPSPGAQMKLVALDPQRRAGVLTQAGILAMYASGISDKPVFRGLAVVERVLCRDIPEVPAGVNDSVPEPMPGQPLTTRQSVEQSHLMGPCAACHQFMDPIGFAFGHYDAIGKWRDNDNGLPVDASGQFVGTEDADGPFDGAVQVATRLAGSKQVARCVATQWFRFGLGRKDFPSDSCALKSLGDELVSNGGDMKALAVALTRSDAFRFRERIVTGQ